MFLKVSGWFGGSVLKGSRKCAPGTWSHRHLGMLIKPMVFATFRRPERNGGHGWNKDDEIVNVRWFPEGFGKVSGEMF